MTTYGDGIGRVYSRPVPSTETGVYRREKEVVIMVGGRQVTLVVRDTVVPEDPYVNLVRAAAYPYQVGGGPFPVPPVPRTIKDVLIKRTITI